MFKALLLCIFVALIGEIVCPPVTTKKPGEHPPPPDSEVGDTKMSDYIAYHHYLEQVVKALESDPVFREKLEKAEEVDIRTGKIANELEYVNHNVRTKLDELKRTELERLKHLATKTFELQNDIDPEHLKIGEHLDELNKHTFEIEDLKKLILKTTHDLAEADKKRRAEFKEYEMQKEFEKQEVLTHLDEEHKKEYLKKVKEQEEKHKKHDPLHHPGSKKQLEEVWEKEDHMENQDFDPKTFFALHDLDGNKVWDQDEVKALFRKELDKMYQAGIPEDDMRERAEEMERMREHVFSEADTNRDGLISYDEFYAQSQKEEFNRDPGWDGLDTQQVYSPEEYAAYEKHQRDEIQRMISQGLLPPDPRVQYGYDGHQQNGQFPPQGHPAYQNIAQQQELHPGQVPQAQYHPQQPPQAQYHPQQPPQGQYHGQQPPQGQYHGQQPPQGQYHAQQPPQGQYQAQQPPQGQYQAQQPPQGQYQAQQPPQGQYQAQQPPQGQYQAQQPPSGQVPQGQQAQQPPHNVNQGQPPAQGKKEVETNEIQKPKLAPVLNPSSAHGPQPIPPLKEDGQPKNAPPQVQVV